MIWKKNERIYFKQKKVGISVLNRINSDILQFIFIVWRVPLAHSGIANACSFFLSLLPSRSSHSLLFIHKVRNSMLFISLAAPYSGIVPICSVFSPSISQVLTLPSLIVVFFGLWCIISYGFTVYLAIVVAWCMSILAGIIIIFPFGKFCVTRWLMKSLNHLHYKRSQTPTNQYTPARIRTKNGKKNTTTTAIYSMNYTYFVYCFCAIVPFRQIRSDR